MEEPSARPRTPIPWVTYALIAANLIAFALEIAAGADPMEPTAQKMKSLGGNFAPWTLNGEWWRLGSAMFLHFGLIHIAMNMIVLFQGRIVETMYGRGGFAAIYLASGLLGGIASLWHASNVVSAGASGAVFGVFGAFGAYLILRRDQLDPRFVQKQARSLGSFVALNLLYGATATGIDLSAHIGGMVAGFLGGAAMLAGARADAQRGMRALIVAVAAVAMTAGALVVMKKPTDIQGLLADFAKVEEQCIEKFNAGRGGEDKAAFADTIDREILPPWRAIRARLDAVSDVPSRLEHLFDLVGYYVKDRQDAWETYATLLRTPSAELQNKFDQLDAKTRADIDAMKAEGSRLKER
jgi:rhomboid protease GluP